MTTPAPGFPPELETAIRAALAEHRLHPLANGRCTCGEPLEVPERADELAAHQAAVVMEVIAQHTTTEWGRSRPVSFKRTRRYVSPTSHRPASVEWDETLVARLVLPWQEVKA